MEEIMKNKVGYISKWLMKDYKEEDAIVEGDEISSKSIELDILLQCLQFLYDQGLMESGMSLFLNFFYQLFRDTVCKALPIDEAVRLIRERVINYFSDGKYTTLFAKSAIDYIKYSLLQHYHLMVYVMCTQRCEELHSLVEMVEFLPQVEPLTTAMPLSVWELETKIKEKEGEFDTHQKALNNQFADITKKLKEEIDEYMVTLKGQPLSSSDIRNFTSTILQKYSHLTNAELELLISTSKEAILLKIEKSKILSGSGSG